MRLYGTVPAIWLDPWGRKHHVDMVVQVADVVRAGSFPHNNGYETTDNAVFVEDCGATYLFIPPIDYGASGHYVRSPKSIHRRVTWRSRLPYRCIGKNGEPYVEVQASKLEVQASKLEVHR